MNLFRKYIVLTLALLITISASGFSISVHKCCGKIKDFSLLGKSAECKMHAQPKAEKECSSKHAFNPEHKDKACCADQKIIIQKTTEACAIQKTPIKEKSSFDVLFVLNFVKNWLGYNTNQEDDEEDTSPSVSVIESLIVLFRQFRI